MNLKLFLLACLSLIYTATNGQGITFEEGNWDEIVTKAKQENKPIFVDAYTEWCGPCKKMAQEVFTQDQIGQYMNQRFVSYKMDMEKGEGIAFALKYGVTAFPTLLYFDSQGEIMYKSVGYKDVEKLLLTSEKALDPKNHIESFRKVYEDSDQSLKSLIAYCKKLREADNYKMAREEAINRLNHLNKNEKYTDDEWELISNYVRSYEDPLFKRFLKHKYKYKNIADEEDINRYIHQVMGNTSLFYNNKEDGGQSLINYIKIVKNLKKYINSTYYIARANYFTHLDSSEQLQFKYASEFLDREFKLDYDEGKTAYYLVFMANRYLEKNDIVYTDAAMRWAEKSAKLDNNDYKNKFVLAQLYYKKRNLNQALKFAEQALQLEKNTVEAGVIKDLFKAESIKPFIEKVKKEIEL